MRGRVRASATWRYQSVHRGITASGPPESVLSQRHGNPRNVYPCAYFTCKLTPAEANYDVGNRELLSIKEVLEEW